MESAESQFLREEGLPVTERSTFSTVESGTPLERTILGISGFRMTTDGTELLSNGTWTMGGASSSSAPSTPLNPPSLSGPTVAAEDAPLLEGAAARGMRIKDPIKKAVEHLTNSFDKTDSSSDEEIEMRLLDPDRVREVESMAAHAAAAAKE